MVRKYFEQQGETVPDPFPESLTDNFFFATPALTQRLDLLRHLIRSGEGLLVLIGEHGAGKSTLLEQLLESADPQWQICFVSPAEFSDNDTTQSELSWEHRMEQEATPAQTDSTSHVAKGHRQLLQHLLEGYNLSFPEQDSDSIQDILLDHIGALRTSGQTPLIIVDDSEALSSDNLQFLVELSYGNEGLGSRIILVCRPESVRRVREIVATTGGNGLIHTVDVLPLDKEQVGDYLHLRWNRASPMGDDPFTDGIIRSIYHASKGLPANINRLADQFLQNRRSKSSRKTRTTRSTQTISGLAFNIIATRKRKLITIGGGIMVLAIVLPWLITAKHEPQPGTKTLTLPIHQTPTTRIQEIKSRKVESQEIGSGKIDPTAAWGNEDEPDTPSFQGNTLPSLAVPRTFDPREPTSQRPITSTKDFTSDSASRHTDVIDTKDVATIPPGSNASVRSRETTTEQTVTGLPNRLTTPSVTTETFRRTDSREIDYFREDEETPSMETNARSDFIRDNNAPLEERAYSGKPKSVRVPEPTSVRTISWLRKQNPSHYTIQLLGTSSKERMLEFLVRHKLDSRAAWFKTKHNNRNWFVVVYGIYPTHKAASAEIRGLSKALRHLDPWPRNVGKILTITSDG
uniref:Cell division protein DamX, binds to the septal ring, contains C-terminal SPOR domain n=1 Tax=Candidatus Kentrum sp. FW TaxID=2126338 RepID=A0A450TYF4_9GAMM|nr:MAG: Cell division protein DamX, binds to the septal ring, contains C-terminal SPOR domain [Candidatus Kentron sp. FW]